MRSMSVPDDVDGVAQLLDLLQAHDLADGALASGGVGLAEAVVLVALQRLEDGFPGALDFAQAGVLVGADGGGGGHCGLLWWGCDAKGVGDWGSTPQFSESSMTKWDQPQTDGVVPA